MLSAAVLQEAEQRRLAWRCRRGLLELDIVLQRFVKEKFSELSLQEVEVFDGLLDLPDNEFWDLIKSDKPHKDKVLASIINKLNTASQQPLKEY